MAGQTVEIITGRERRRRWSSADELRIVAQTFEAGACVRQVAARHDLSPGLVFTWRRHARDGMLAQQQPSPVFLPVRAAAAAPSPPDLAAPASRADHRIEIALKDGSRVRVGAGGSLVSHRLAHAGAHVAACDGGLSRRFQLHRRGGVRHDPPHGRPLRPAWRRPRADRGAGLDDRPQTAELVAQGSMLEALRLQLARLKRMRFGRSSERLDAAIAQPTLALEDLEACVERRGAPLRRKPAAVSR